MAHRPLGVGVGLVGTPGAGLHGVAEVLPEYRVDVGNAPDGAADPVGDGGTGPFGGTAAGALASTEPEGLAELLDEGVQFGFGAVGALGRSRIGPGAPPTSTPPISSSAGTSRTGELRR